MPTSRSSDHFPGNMCRPLNSARFCAARRCAILGGVWAIAGLFSGILRGVFFFRRFLLIIFNIT